MSVAGVLVKSFNSNLLNDSEREELVEYVLESNYSSQGKKLDFDYFFNNLDKSKGDLIEKTILKSKWFSWVGPYYLSNFPGNSKTRKKFLKTIRGGDQAALFIKSGFCSQQEKDQIINKALGWSERNASEFVAQLLQKNVTFSDEQFNRVVSHCSLELILGNLELEPFYEIFKDKIDNNEIDLNPVFTSIALKAKRKNCREQYKKLIVDAFKINENNKLNLNQKTRDILDSTAAIKLLEA